MVAQPSLLDLPVRFDSGVELRETDHVRLGAQIRRVLTVLQEGGWWSVPAIGYAIYLRFDVNDPQPSISAQIRNLRKAKHGGYQIERRRDPDVPLYEFRLVGH